jgi:hypothetical protein
VKNQLFVLMKLLFKRIIVLLTVLYFIAFALLSEEKQTVNLCAEAGRLGEDAWRECIDSYPGLTVDQITGKSPIPSPGSK